ADGLITRSALRGRSWLRLLPDVYVHRDTELDHRTWCAAVALTLPVGAALGGLSAAYLWGVDLLPRDAPVTVVAPRSIRLRRDARIAARYTTLTRNDVTRLGGLAVTTPERTAFDLGRQAPRADALVAVDALLHRGVSLGALEQLAAERCRWPGAPLLRAVLLLAEPLSESPMETRLRLLIVDAGLPPPVAQHTVRDSTGRFVGRVDLAWPALRLAVEYEGDHHRERAQFQRDVARLNALRAAGWTVLRFTADDVLRRPAHTVSHIISAMRELAQPRAGANRR
ncbi:MAG TPA: DUF559 domain-containing protein, partial [Actinoplanes sp.]|nr:DUF559 domain-containing protein [Actinoplanes sp.]